MKNFAEYINSYLMTDTQRDIWVDNHGKWSLEWESQNNGDMMYHVHTIHSIARGINAKIIVDLGVRNGQATRALLYAAKQAGGRVWSVDIEDCSYVCPSEFKDNWFFFQMSTDDFFNQIIYPKKMEIDLLLIDADHSYEQSKIDFENYSQCIRTNGIVIMHDTYPAKECRKKWPGGAGGVWKTWQEIDENNWDKLILPYSSGIGIARKRGLKDENNKELIPNSEYFGCDLVPSRYGGDDHGKEGIWNKNEFKLWQKTHISPFDD